MSDSNDLSYLVCDLCDIYSYTDYNTICVRGNKIENVSNVLMNWFKEIFFMLILKKFQFILFRNVKSENSIVVDHVSLMMMIGVLRPLFGTW